VFVELLGTAEKHYIVAIALQEGVQQLVLGLYIIRGDNMCVTVTPPLSYAYMYRDLYVKLTEAVCD
jgi:hypothetical protein